MGLLKTKSALVAALDEQKAIADSEAKERVALLAKYRNLEHEADGLKEHLDEESGSKDNISRQLNKALGEADMYRQKYEIDGLAKAEELEMSRLKLQARLSESQATIEQLNAKLHQIEKSKAKTQADLNDMSVQLDQAQILNASMEKKAKQCDRIVGEWKLKVEGLSRDLDIAQNEHEVYLLNFLRSKMPMMRQLFSWMRCAGRTKLFQMKSRTSWTRYPKVEDLFMRLIKSERDLKLKKWSWKQPYLKLKVPLSKRKIKY